MAETEEDLDAVRDLIRAFVTWHRERHLEDRHLIDGYFDAGEFEAELAGLPGTYQPLLLARCDGQPAGCVALRRLDDHVCEMKRMYVDTRFRGRGVGRALTERLLADARTFGYAHMRLDTSIRQAEALGLYARFGFTPIEPLLRALAGAARVAGVHGAGASLSRRPVTTDSGRSATMSEPGRASSSLRLISSHCGFPRRRRCAGARTRRAASRRAGRRRRGRDRAPPATRRGRPARTSRDPR